jgi:Tfp pilus assembly protein PilE
VHKSADLYGSAEPPDISRRTPRAHAAAQDGFALIDLIFVIGIIAVLAMIALPKVVLARQSAGAASAIGSLRAINSAQLTYAFTCGGGFYAPNLTTLGEPPPTSTQAFLSANLTTGDEVIRAGYMMQIGATPFAGAPPSCNGLGGGEAAQAFMAAADSLEPQNGRFFATNANGQIWEHTSSLLGIMPEAGEPPVGHLIK